VRSLYRLKGSMTALGFEGDDGGRFVVFHAFDYQWQVISIEKLHLVARTAEIALQSENKRLHREALDDVFLRLDEIA
jgi:hypothetical protein